MEAVNEFKSEVNSLYETRLPVSRAKISQITKLALKAVKHYKHVVMIVEKFISKCASSYKLAGLYVIDSIVRQSQHQFTGDRDVFTLRFAKNFSKTFTNLFQCSTVDQGKVLRVLNIWQKNGVYSPTVIQPLLSLAPGERERVKEEEEEDPPAAAAAATAPSSQVLLEQQQQLLEQQQQQLQALVQAGGVPATELAILLQKAKQLQQLQNLQQHLMKGPPVVPVATARAAGAEFNEALLDNDFDYSSEEEGDDGSSSNLHHLYQQNNQSMADEVSASELIDQMQEQFQQQQQQHVWNTELPPVPPQQQQQHQPTVPPQQQQPTVSQQPAPAAVEASYQLPPLLPPPPPPLPPLLPPPPSFTGRCSSPPPGSWHPPPPPPPLPMHRYPPPPPRWMGEWHPPPPPRHHTPPQHRNHTPPPRHRHRDHTPPYSRRSPRYRDRSPHRLRKRTLPGPRSECVTVCSTTIWLGHLAKSVTPEIIRETCEKYGPVKSVDLVAARGCAYIVMAQRSDANIATEKLKDVRINGNYCKVAWAPGRGVKGPAYQSCWDLDHGVSFIPWEKLKSTSDVENVCEGGWVDPATLPHGLRKPETASGKIDDMMLSNTPP